ANRNRAATATRLKESVGAHPVQSGGFQPAPLHTSTEGALSTAGYAGTGADLHGGCGASAAYSESTETRIAATRTLYSQPDCSGANGTLFDWPHCSFLPPHIQWWRSDGCRDFVWIAPAPPSSARA